MDIEDILKLNDRSGKIFKEAYIKKHYKSIYLRIINYCHQNNLINLPFKQKMYHYYHDIPNYCLCDCGNILFFINFNLGYSKHCSQKCTHNDKLVINKTKETLICKYGVDNLQKSNIIKEKTYKTNYKKYGVKIPTQSKVIQEKIKNTTFNNLGVYYPSQDNNVRDKYYKTIIKKNIDKYDKLIEIDYIMKKMIFQCDCGQNHNFQISTDLFQNRKKANLKLCTICNTKFTSQSENAFLNIFNNLNITYIHNDRKIISPLELDIYIPELKLAFEFNGLWWHNEINKENNYHLIKTELCEQQGIQLIHIWEDDWLYKQDIIKSLVFNELGFSNKTSYIGEIKEVNDNNLVKCFLQKNYISGYVPSNIKIGLFHNNELISLMLFKIKNKKYEFLCFCNKLNNDCVDVAEDLFNYFLTKYNPNEIIAYADRCISNGRLYEKLKFKYIEKTTPNYYYIINGVRKCRYNYKKMKLIKQGFDLNKSEHEIMLERKIYRIYDSGKIKYIWKNMF